MINPKRVRLDTLSGFDFEKFCAMVFDRLGYGRVENLPSGPDKGRDLIIHGERKIIVECKHQPNATIGRPVIQKLHSAVISEKADGGWVVTTGEFTRQAREHAKEISGSGVELKLIDRAMLVDMAHRAGIEVLSKSDTPVMFSVSPTPEQVMNQVAATLTPRLLRQLTLPALADCLSVRGVTVVPVFSANFDVHQDWYVGSSPRNTYPHQRKRPARDFQRLLHSVHLSDQSLFLYGHLGGVIEEPVLDFVRNAPLSNSAAESVPVEPQLIERVSSESSLHDIYETIREAVRRAHSVRLLHQASNGQKYYRDCTVGDRNIFIHDVTEILVPHWQLECRLGKQIYEITCLAQPTALLLKETNLFKCRICLKDIEGSAIVCDSCGNVVHPRTLRRRHSTQCSPCHRTLCSDCVANVRLFWPLTRRYCANCNAMRTSR